MPGSTTRFVIPYPLTSDTVASLPTTDQNASQRVDLLLGEGGTASITVAANTAGSIAVTFARSYTGVVGTGSAVLTQFQSDLGAGVTYQVWITGMTGAGFTLNYRFSTAQSARGLSWRFLPCLP